MHKINQECHAQASATYPASPAVQQAMLSIAPHAASNAMISTSRCTVAK
jgi:hypothetical protein